MDYLDWLNNDDEFPRLGATSCQNKQQLDDDDDDWCIVSYSWTIPFSDMVKKKTSQQNDGWVWVRKNKPIIRHNSNNDNNNNNNDDDDDDYTGGLDELVYLRKSKARQRHRNKAWIHQHRVTVLTRLGYGHVIQGLTFWDPEYDALGAVHDTPLQMLPFLHCWRFICYQDCEPEVDRRRKSNVQSLLLLTR